MRDDVSQTLERRRFIQQAAAGTVITALGGLYVLAGDEAYAEERSDGRPRIPPGQRVIKELKPMGGQEGSPSRSKFKLRVHGEVDHPFTVDFDELQGLGTVTQSLDVHCVTGWTALGKQWQGVRLKTLADKAGVNKRARHVIFEAAHGYTSNVRLREALAPSVMVAWELGGKRLRRAHGAPVRAVVPDLYFWKSAKWLTGIKFVRKDEPGYWETRGYHNHADPWEEERHG